MCSVCCVADHLHAELEPRSASVTIAGRKRTRNGEDGHEAAEADGLLRQRDERSERRARRERRRQIAEASSAAESTTRSDEGSSGTPEVWCEEATADDGRDAGAGGLGDRTGVG